MSYVVFECVIPYIQDTLTRQSISLVCKRGYEVESQTRKHVMISLCYAATPKQLLQRFPNLESLKLKGKPRAALYNLIPEDWGGFVKPWVEEIAASFSCLKAVHFRRMIVYDSDLELLAKARGGALQVVKLDKCSGFSTDGLKHICRCCRYFSEFVLSL